jgi:hypothetical protein
LTCDLATDFLEFFELLLKLKSRFLLLQELVLKSRDIGSARHTTYLGLRWLDSRYRGHLILFSWEIFHLISIFAGQFFSFIFCSKGLLRLIVEDNLTNLVDLQVI